ncbi:MAG: DUF3298 and DUF4163 domain-containing protein [Fimbriimonadales bacterium]|nr:DUF3298 and DUF4163 domain-containing protein [Fimbriimonadales bacterium]
MALGPALVASLVLAPSSAQDLVRLCTLAAPAGLRASVRVVVADFGNGPAQVAATRAMRARAEAILQDFAAAARETLRRMREHRDAPRWELWLKVTPKVSLNQRSRVSAYLEVDTFTGGAHPNRWFETFNYVAEGGRARPVRLQDLLMPGQRQNLLDWWLLPALNEQKEQRGAEAVAAIDDRALGSFVATPTALVWLFAPYEVGPYAEGSYVVKLPLENLRGYVRRTHPLLRP